ncbi:MAG: VOC family protein [Maricaulaceae bacterium]|nr:VOC family protein [Maricaulaceae bacterium]
MEQRLSLITLGVENPARSKAFYQSLGWKPAFEADDIVFFPLNGIVFALFRRAALDADMGRENAGPGAFALAYNVRGKAEIEPVLAAAQAAGGAILKPAEDTEWGGRSGYFADPDGHAWEVAWNPHWPIDAAGNVSMGG